MAVLNATFPWWLYPYKLIKDINWFILVLLLIKETFNLIEWQTQQATTNQRVVASGATFPWWLTPRKKHWRSLDSFHRYLRSKNPTTWLDERQKWSQPTKKGKSHMLPSLDDYLYAKNIRTHTILFRNIDDQRILQSDWSRGRIGHIPNKKMLTFAYDYLHAKRSKILIDFFETYCWSKNSAIWLAKRHNWPHLIKIGSCPFLWLSLYK